jgi:creatinine amidohydrolase
MLALLPEQVKMNLAVKEYPRDLTPNSLLSMEGDLPFAWLTRELSDSGVMGYATSATQEKGAKILASLAESWVKVIEDVYEFNYEKKS